MVGTNGLFNNHLIYFYLGLYPLILITTVFTGFPVESAKCPLPKVPLHGQATTKWNGNVVQYHCRSGYTLVGSPTSMCRNGEWNHPPPICRSGQPERSKSLQYSLLRSLSDLQYQEDYHLPTTRKPWASSHIGHDSNRPLFDWGSVPQASGNSPLPNDKITATSYQTGIISVASGIPSSKSRNVIRQTDKEIRAPYFGPETRAAISTKKTNNRPRRKKMKPGKLASSNEKTTKSTPSYFNKALKFQHKTVVLSNDKSQKNIVISDPTLPPPFPERKIISNSAIHKVNNVDETKLSIMSGTKGISSSDNIMSRLNIGSTSSTTSLQASRVEFPKLLSTNPTKNLTQQKASVDNQYFLATNYSDMNIRNLDMSCGHNNTQNSSNNFLPAPKIGNGIVEVYRRRHNPEEPFNSYLEVLYTCKDGYHFKNALVHSLYCFQRKWIGELPSCISESAVKADGREVDVDDDDDPELGTKASCAINKGHCEHTCVDVTGGVQCLCYRGYRLNSDNRTCTDVDECQENNRTCEYQCWNIPGSFICYCPHGYALSSNRRSCLDRNECLLNNGHGPCQDLCSNTEGGYQCSCSIPGTQLAMDNHTCEDINECEDNNFGCTHSCINTIGSAFCSCHQGYMLGGDWKACEDIDECQFPELAHSCRGECVNTVGSYKCRREGKLVDPHTDREFVNDDKHEVICDSGYYKDENGECLDIDECHTNNFGCSHTCINNPGSAACQCPTGFQLLEDWKTCEDINECSTNNGDCEHDCIDTPGSYQCVCREGHHLAEDNKSCTALQLCPPLSSPLHGIVKPTSCLMHSKEEGELCFFDCDPGYLLMGTSKRTCNGHQQWEPIEQPQCIRIEYEEPEIKCPHAINVDIPPNQKKMVVHLLQPESNVAPSYIKISPSWIQNNAPEFPVGEFLITYTAYHPITNHTSSCVLRVTVHDRQPPITYNCPQPISNIFIGDGQQTTAVFWEEPVFIDNIKVTYVWKSKEPGSKFPPGVHHIKYTARDAAGNTGHCAFTIRVSKSVRSIHSKNDYSGRLPSSVSFYHRMLANRHANWLHVWQI